jgi:hypothetical protein
MLTTKVKPDAIEIAKGLITAYNNTLFFRHDQQADIFITADKFWWRSL